MRDYRTAGLEPRWTALLALVEKVTRQPDITPEDIEGVKSHGWSDEAIYDAITVCALFNFYNTWIDGCGVPGLPDYTASGQRMAKDGYARE
jgi:alkylhydroperoxidase family enzyme